MKSLATITLLCSLTASIPIAQAVEIPGSDATMRAREEANRHTVARSSPSLSLTAGSSAAMLGYSPKALSTGRSGWLDLRETDKTPDAPRSRQIQPTSFSHSDFPF